MLGRSKADGTNYDRDSLSVQQRPAVASSAVPEVSSISAGLSIVGKIVGHGALTIFGHVEGGLRASTVVIAEGAQMEGEVSAEELTIGGHVKGTIHANRVKLNSTAVVEGDIFHRTLAIEENARFEGTSRRSEKYDRYAVARPNEPHPTPSHVDRRQPEGQRRTRQSQSVSQPPHVRFGSKADTPRCPRHVRVTSDALLHERQYRVRQVEKQRSAEKANHAAQRQIKALTGACNLTFAINVLRGLNKAPAGDHDNSNTEHDERQAGGISKRAAMRSDLLLGSKWCGVSQE